jgi:zinc protease
MRVMNAVLGGGFTSRINVNLRERHGYTYGASSSLDLGRDVGLLTLQTNVSTESTAASIRELLNEVAAMRDAPVGAEELARAKDSLSLSLPADFATGTSTAAAVGQLYLANLPPDYYQDLPAAIARTDAEDVQAVARAHLQPEEMKVVAVGDPTQIDPQLTQLALGPVAYLNPDGTPLATG